MYTIKNKTFADAGYYLERGSSIAYSFENNNEKIEEKEIVLDDMHLFGQVILCTDGKIAQRILPRGDYSEYKKALVKKRYSNDDQIAIMLNRDSGDEADIIAYDKMQEWRNWASTVAKRIIELISNN